MDAASLRNRLVVATNLWREATDDPLPRMPPGDPTEQIEGFELKVDQFEVGQVVEGMENVDKINRGEPPANPDKMLSVRVAADQA